MVRVGAALVAALLMLLAGCSNEPVSNPPPPAIPTPQAEPTQIVVGVGDFPPGFNPHLVADQSPITTALSTLVLPSVFRITADGTPQLDPTIATSAKVTSQNPFTVSYELNLEASWSDNAPIAAEDFVYLWEQMRDRPGTIDAAGYRLITDVRSRAGGKAVDVVFAHPYPAWQRLFSGLLPAHLVKDAPGSWIGATAGGLPAAGGPFKLATVDRARGDITLTRNDAYWSTPTVLDQLVLRREGPTSLASGMATGDVPIALTDADPVARSALAGVSPAPRVQPAPQPTVLQLALRADAGPLRELSVRTGVAELIDREAIRQATAPDALAADALGLAPSQPGYAATIPGTIRSDPTAAAAALQSAGWHRDAAGRWVGTDGKPVRLVIGAAAERPVDQRVAEAVAGQLQTAGIDTVVVAPPGDALFGQDTVPLTPPSVDAAPAATDSATTASATPTPSAAPTSAAASANGVSVDVLVVPRAVGGDPGSVLASDYGCSAASGLVPDAPRPPGGFCLPALAAPLDKLLGPNPPAGAVADAEKLLWTQIPALPLFQPVTLVVSTTAAEAATSIQPGPLVGGPFTGATRWRPVAK